jgi:hypothetical protein
MLNSTSIPAWIYMTTFVTSCLYHLIASLPLTSTMTMEAAYIFETLVSTYNSRWYHDPEDIWTYTALKTGTLFCTLFSCFNGLN